METKLQELVNQIGTDVSGKWIAVDKVNQLIEHIICECADIATINQYQHDSAGKYILEHFGLGNTST